MTIAEEITRLSNAKANIKQAIENKGVEVSDSALLDEYPALIDSIEVGGGGGGADPFYEIMWNMATNNNTNYSHLFRDYNGTELDVSNWDTSKVTDMDSMFYSCYSLISLDVSNFNTSKVADMSYMFNGCYSLTQLDVSNFDTSKVTTMVYMFGDCRKLTSINVSNFDTSNVTSFQAMFSNCESLTELDLSNFNNSKVTTMTMMFYYCKSLMSLNLSTWDVSKVNASYMISNIFKGCTALVDFMAPKNISIDMNMSDCNNLSHDSLMSIINNLITTTSSKTFTLGATNKAKLTDEELAIATNKGWKIA